MLSPKVSPPTPHKIPYIIAGKAPPLLHNSVRVLPAGIASNAPSSGKTSHAKMPCTSQKLSQDQFFTLLIGTYELLCPKLPMAIISKPISVFISSMFFPVLEI